MVRWTISLALVPALATACECVSKTGAPVLFGEQQTIIVWNAATHTEHFIRDARFQSVSTDFGFLAPSPTKPQLAEAKEEAFGLLASLRPRPNEEAAAGDAPKADVPEEVHVAGYKAAIFPAKDARQVSGWLESHGYRLNKQSTAWMEHYESKDWYITAFQVEDAKEVAKTGVIRMSFTTDQPFEPFYISDDSITPESGFSGYVISTTEVRGRVPGTDIAVDAEWQAKLPQWVAEELVKDLDIPLSDLPKDAIVSSVWSKFHKGNHEELYFDHVVRSGPATFVWNVRGRLPSWPVLAGGFGILCGAAALLLALRKRAQKPPQQGE